MSMGYHEDFPVASLLRPARLRPAASVVTERQIARAPMSAGAH